MKFCKNMLPWIVFLPFIVLLNLVILDKYSYLDLIELFYLIAPIINKKFKSPWEKQRFLSSSMNRKLSTKCIFVAKEIKTEFVENPRRLENILDQQPQR